MKRGIRTAYADGAYTGAGQVARLVEFDRMIAEVERAAAVRATSLMVELQSFAPRFWKKVEVSNGSKCWPWTGATVGFGHGSFSTPAGHTAHRFAWALANGRLPQDGLVIRHKCDNPPCCNPAHLEEGTQRQNVLDMVERGGAGYTNEVCRNGHPRTVENTRVTSSGQRRCDACDRETWERRRVRGIEEFNCHACGKSMQVYNLKRHLKDVHADTWTVDELRARAAEIRASAVLAPVTEEGDRDAATHQ